MLFCAISFAQSASDIVSGQVVKLDKLIEKGFARYNKKYEAKKEQFLKDLVTEDSLLRSRLSTDSIHFNSSRYLNNLQRLQDSLYISDNVADRYVGRLDSLDQFTHIADSLGIGSGKLKSDLASYRHHLKEQIHVSNTLKQYDAYLNKLDLSRISDKSQLKQVENLLGDIRQSIGKYNVSTDQLRQRFLNARQLTKHLTKLCSNIPNLNKYIQQYGTYARLYGNAQNGRGALTEALSKRLQTSEKVFSQIQNSLGGSLKEKEDLLRGRFSKAQEQVKAARQQTDSAFSELKSITSKDSTVKQSRNPEPVGKRLEYNFNSSLYSIRRFDVGNVQDLGINIGYKFSHRLVTGLGLTYKFNTGSNFFKFDFHHESITGRVFSEYKMFSSGKSHKILKDIWGRSEVEASGLDRSLQTEAGNNRIIYNGSLGLNYKPSLLKKYQLQVLYKIPFSTIPANEKIVIRFGVNL
ncbi:hypothetical protein [Polluticaenibacter yanchengensis]|uniref:Uncharacterized protein n=1 Tax=Polluticaenibacter yanchengensis TaxID=3014562 RepID=A0ABT4UP44_9BACT|nr:hypothetical protein [Chitinophagaceae bacterium LY-5]